MMEDDPVNEQQGMNLFDKEDLEIVKNLFQKKKAELGPQLQPQLNRWKKVATTTAKQTILEYLRENDIDEDMLTQTDYDFLTDTIEGNPPSDSPYFVATYVKKYIFRQLKRLHSPLDTAKYLKYSFNETLEYFLVFTFYLVLIYASCNRLPYVFCIFFRFIMSIHLGYYTYLWFKKILTALRLQTMIIVKFIYDTMFYVPAIAFETIHVLFDAFVGWPLLSSILGMFFMIYLFPIAFPEMGLSSVYVEMYSEYVGELPTFVKIITFVI